MAVVADRRWHRKIDAHHTYRDLGNETLGRISIAREHRNRVALVMDVRVAQRLLERLRTNDLQHGAEDLVLVALHRRRGVIDQGRPQEKSLLMARQAPAPPVDDQLGALVDSQLDIAFNLFLCSAVTTGPFARRDQWRRRSAAWESPAASSSRIASAVFWPTGTITGMDMHRSPAEPKAPARTSATT